jgi:hypothetical protein
MTCHYDSLRLALAATVAVCAGAGCKTRLWDLDGGQLLTADFAAHPAGDLAGDLATGPQDLAVPPDFAVPLDFTVFPDLVPPPDLTPPHYCDGIFVFQGDQHLAFFDPKQLTFHDIGLLNCPVGGGAAPFSMAVDRLGTAWVEYTNGDLFTVDTYTAQCQPTMYQPGQHGFQTFGMGFAADAPGSPKETLYLARGDYQRMGVSPELGSLDVNTLRITDIGPLPDLAELTGTGAGELWAFFAAVNPHYGRVDKMTGQVNLDIPVPMLGDVSQDAFAFGFFGGVFYVFLSPQGSTTTVYRLDPVGRTAVPVLANTGRIVVGAGVSTCAPQK